MCKKIISRLTVFFLIVLFLVNVLSTKEEAKALERRGENLIRFHVLANSDSPEDQQLKLRVRDRVIDIMLSDLDTCKNINETRNVLIFNLNKIERVVEEEIAKSGRDYAVKVILGEHDFPTKSYGSAVFPAGTYEALRIEIGQAKGENWWCVMFPPLCFIDVRHGLTDEKTKTELKQSLTSEEYHNVYASVNEKGLPLKLKSKVFEFVKSSAKQLRHLKSIF